MATGTRCARYGVFAVACVFVVPWRIAVDKFVPTDCSAFTGYDLLNLIPLHRVTNERAAWSHVHALLSAWVLHFLLYALQHRASTNALGVLVWSLIAQSLVHVERLGCSSPEYVPADLPEQLVRPSSLLFPDTSLLFLDAITCLAYYFGVRASLDGQHRVLGMFVAGAVTAYAGLYRHVSSPSLLASITLGWFLAGKTDRVVCGTDTELSRLTMPADITNAPPATPAAVYEVGGEISSGDDEIVYDTHETAASDVTSGVADALRHTDSQ
jgi:hypothetical protein